METFRLRVRLRDVRPEVVRVVDLPAAATLDEVHLALQVAVGWTDSHLHEFTAGEQRWASPDPDDEDAPDERRVRLRDLPARWVYTYDFGDGWTHDVELLGAGADRPGCVSGEGDCPPEDCGGPGGYEEVREALADPGHDLHDVAAEIRAFDEERVDVLVCRAIGQVPSSVRMLLEVVGDGVTPTGAGRLPRDVVQDVQLRRPEWARTDGPARREDDLPALRALHGVLASVGLLRRHRGRLVPLRAASDDREVLRRLRRRFDPQTVEGTLTEVTVATLLAADPMTAEELAAAVADTLGPFVEFDARVEVFRARATLEGLGQLAFPDGLWDAGPDAGWLLPRAVLLADLWSGD